MKETHKQRQNIIARMNRIEGHTRGVIKMMEEERSCPDLLHQIAAIKAALNKVEGLIIEDHIENCLNKAISEGTTQTYIDELKEAISKIL